MKLTARFKVRLLPLIEKDEAPALIEHWLFCSVPATPNVSGDPQEVPASF